MSARSLCVEHLTVSLDSSKTLLSDVSFSVDFGQCLAVIGPSGAGKTQLARALVGWQPTGAQITGRVSLNNPLVGAGHLAAAWQSTHVRIALMEQDSQAALTPHLTLHAQLAHVLAVHGHRHETVEQRTPLYWLQQVQMPEPQRRLGQYPAQLSGGLRQRFALALALAQRPAVLIVDEPTSAMDALGVAQFLALIAQLKHQGECALVLISHDLAAVARIADQVLVMAEGTVVEAAACHQVFTTPRHPITAALLGRPVSVTSELNVAGPDVPVGQPMRVLQLNAVSCRIAGRQILQQVSLELAAGESVALIGASAAGKTSCLRVMAGLTQPDSGQVITGHRSDDFLKPAVLLYQDAASSLDPRLPIRQSLSLALSSLRSQCPPLLNDEPALLDSVLIDVGLDIQLLDRYPHQLSLGQCQRVQLARALLQRPQVLLLDEITSALDHVTAMHITRLLLKLKEKGCALFWVSHDLALVKMCCSRVLVMDQGRVVEAGPTAQIFQSPQHPVTKALVGATLAAWSVPGES